MAPPLFVVGFQRGCKRQRSIILSGLLTSSEMGSAALPPPDETREMTELKPFLRRLRDGTVPLVAIASIAAQHERELKSKSLAGACGRNRFFNHANNIARKANILCHRMTINTYNF